MLGVLFCLLAVVSFGLNKVTVRRGVITGTPTQAVAVAMPIGLALFVAGAALSGELGKIGLFSGFELAVLASAGIVHFVFGRYCSYRTIQAVGANLAAPIHQGSLMVTLALAVTALGERLDALKLAGIALLLFGPRLAIGAQGRAPAAGAPAASFQPRILEGYFFGLLTCLTYGLSPVLIRAGLESTGLGLAGGVVSHGAATVVALALVLLPAARRDVARLKRENLKWFVWTAVAVGVSQVFLYLATARMPISVVQPILRLDVLFTVLFGWMLNRQHEIFSPGLMAAIVMSTGGAMLLVVDPGTMARWLDAPPWAAAALAWSWPVR